ncbi:dynein axonemal intermediate chain 2 isoform X3 [Bombus huntii]|uniref:dynein axonemal intermediate chain 2 isoform X3 n=1 Tax=Bombus huntii TaxID=85661 RepID=UPI0021AAA4FF|nr:dynein axonemal intermediate chain 2 isoform X3 [Bombus huntii]
MKNINMQYTYTKKRLQFGKQCNFTNYDKVEADIKPHAESMTHYIQIDPVTQGTQCSKIYSVHEVNTNTATFRDSGIYHSEGGWPKDLNAKDIEQAVRYKRKIEKDELYIHTMLQLLPPMEQCILQNNVCNIYEQYFSYMEPVSLIQRVYSRTVNVYRDILPIKRQITHLSWSPDQGNRFAASYCNTDFKNAINDNPQSYIWDVDNVVGYQKITNAYRNIALQFEPSMGTRFMCGLENGIVISGNRKGKTSSEKIATRFKAQYGPIISLERNPTFVKNFLTVGDWTTRIWSEDCKESCIAWTPGHRDFLMGGAWSITRFSVFFLIKMDGTLDVWDLLIQQDSPVLSVKVCDEVLTYIKPHEQGRLATIANKKGTTFLLEFSEALIANQKNDKLLFTALLDRETRREKIKEAKNREQRLKMKSLRNINTETECTTGSTKNDEKNLKCSNSNTNDAVLIHCEEDYDNAIKAELLKEEGTNNEIS